MATLKTIFLVSLSLTCALGADARAQSFSYPDFTNFAGISPVGLTTQVGAIMRLQDNVAPANGGDNRGAAWYDTAVNVAGGFDTTFTYRMHTPSTTGGSDGMAFVIQNDQIAGAPMVNGIADGTGNLALGRHAAAAGFGVFVGSVAGESVDNSLAIHLDTYNNSNWGDTNSNHISIHTGSTGDNSQDESFSIARTGSLATDLNNGLSHTVRVLYVPGTLEVYLDGNLQISVAYDFTSGGTYVDSANAVGGLNLIGGSSAFVGFTSGAGSAREFRDIESWSFTSTADNTGNPACDSSTGQCPCFTVGAVDHGCPNSNSSNGGKLVATGNASVTPALDTFAMTATECAASTAGLILSGTVDLSPGINTINDNAGLLCVGGTTVRGAVVFTDAAGNASFPDFAGAQFGQASNVTANMLSTYQYWYRDPGTACAPNDTAASDFNFTNSWAVTFLP